MQKLFDILHWCYTCEFVTCTLALSIIDNTFSVTGSAGALGPLDPDVIITAMLSRFLIPASPSFVVSSPGIGVFAGRESKRWDAWAMDVTSSIFPFSC